MFPLDCHLIFLLFALLSVVCIFLPLVYYETDADMEKARREQDAAAAAVAMSSAESERTARDDDDVDDADAGTSLLHASRSSIGGVTSKSYGSISQV
jgi:hypothetical protein